MQQIPQNFQVQNGGKNEKGKTVEQCHKMKVERKDINQYFKAGFNTQIFGFEKSNKIQLKTCAKTRI